MLKARAAGLPGLAFVEAAVHRDARGFFYEAYNERDFTRATGAEARFVQDNHSHSLRNVLRGLHYQVGKPQGKLVRVVHGEVFDVALDVRRSSPTLGRWSAARMRADEMRALWIPPGFAHGFLVVSESADVAYKTTEYWAPALERTIAWDDPALAIAWPLAGPPALSEKDAHGTAFSGAELIE
jgi:dTDP-4-dehydrorhamnose 3,5-epimerase